MIKRIYLLYFFIIIALCSCTKSKQWVFSHTIDLKNIKPLGISYFKENLWISAIDRNQIIEYSLVGEIQNIYKGFYRPTHINHDDEKLYVPEYNTDKITQIKNKIKSTLSIPYSLDGPTSIFIYHNEIAITDFHNHRLLYYNGKFWKTFGEKGHNAGKFYYPTDVQITKNKIWVADAYNNRIQVFNKHGKFLQIIGGSDKMNASTGIYVSEEQILITDFENHRVLIYNFKGKIEQIIQEGLNKPSDILIIKNKLYIANYGGKNISVYQMK